LKPTVIIGSSGVVLLNVKTKSLVIYYAKKGETLSVKGSTLLNIDEDNSSVRKIRNFEELMNKKTFNFPTFTHADKFFTSLKTKPSKPKDRINSNSIILAVKK
jgi:hypothetical protein